MSRLFDAAWWYWLATVVFLIGWLSGCKTCLYLAVALCVVQAVHFAWRRRSAAAFPVQVRLAYLALLITGLWPPLRLVHWIQLAGTSARILWNYCFLARLLSLLPWNRREPLTAGLVRRTFLTPSVRRTRTESAAAVPSAECACSLTQRPRAGALVCGSETDGPAIGAEPACP